MRNTMIKLLLWTVLASLALSSPGSAPTQAQGSCNDIIRQFERALAVCKNLNRNQVCYANYVTRVQPENLRFRRPPDQQDLMVFQSISTNPRAGAAVMRLQPVGMSYPVNIFLYGGGDLRPVDSPVSNSPLAFRFDVANPGDLCDRTPPAMAVHATNGQPVRIVVNNVIIDLGSTALITMPDPDSMIVANLAGNVAATVPGEHQVIPPRWQTRVVGIATSQLRFSGQPEPSRLATSPVASWLIGPTGIASVRDPNTEAVPGIPACGGPIAIGQTVVDRNTVPGQECLYTLCVEAGATVTISMDRIDRALDPWVDLRAPNMTLVKANDDIAIGNRNTMICNQGLPVSGCYTVVARSFRNQTAGAFRLTVSGQSTCTAPPQRCEVVAANGIALYDGPNGASMRKVLPFGTEVEARTSTTSGGWVSVQAVTTGEYGWIDVSPQAVWCDSPKIEFPTPAPAESESESESGPAEEPSPEPTDCPKSGPFPGP